MNVEKNQNNQQFEAEGVVNLLFSCIICPLKKTVPVGILKRFTFVIRGSLGYL
jgi:hypothetical protein